MDGANKILKERYKYLSEKHKKKYRIDIKMIQYHLNIIVVMKILNHVISESNVQAIMSLLRNLENPKNISSCFFVKTFQFVVVIEPKIIQ